MFHSTKNIISLDSQILGNYNFRLSRLYDTFGYRYLGFHISNLEEINKIPEDREYVLYDDDICGGSTINFAREYLRNKNIKIIIKLFLQLILFIL